MGNSNKKKASDKSFELDGRNAQRGLEMQINQDSRSKSLANLPSVNPSANQQALPQINGIQYNSNLYNSNLSNVPGVIYQNTSSSNIAY